VQFAKLSDVRVGTKLVPDAGFTCMEAGAILEVAEDDKGLFVPCSHGRHYLDGQLEDGVEYIGLVVER
jgi:hypothetical protein